MMMTEKYYTLPPPSSSSSSFCHSTTYHSSNTKRIREIKNRLHSQRKPAFASDEPTNMKLLLEQQPIIRTYSLYDVQERIDYFEKKKLFDDEIENKCKDKILSHSSSSATGDTLQSVIANTLQQTFCRNESYGSALSRAMMNSATTGKRRTLSSSQIMSSNDQKRSQRYCSLLAKRARTYSLSNHSTMAITATTSFSEEQTTEPQETTSIDYENTYFYPEENTRLDDVLSLTTITPNIQLKTINRQQDLDACSDTTVSQSDTEDPSEEIAPAVQQHGGTDRIDIGSDSPNEQIKNNNEQIIQRRFSLKPADHDFTGVVHATKCTIVQEKECLSDYDNVNHHGEQDTMIRSKADNLSLAKSTTTTTSMQEDHCRRISPDEQLNQQENRTNAHLDSISAEQQAVVYSLEMKMATQYENDDDEDDDGHYSDGSNCSEDFRLLMTQYSELLDHQGFMQTTELIHRHLRQR